MVDAVSSQGGLPNIQSPTGQAKPAAPPAQSSTPVQTNTPGDTTATAASDGLAGVVDGDLSNDQALAQSQAAGQQLANSGLSIANRSPQALASALPA